jgi:hypothetical protein
MRRRTSCRSRATKVQSPRISSVGSRRSGTIILVIPAEDAERTPSANPPEPSTGQARRRQLSSVQEWIGRGLARRVIPLTDNRLEATGQVMSRQMVVHPVVRRGRGDSPREPQVGQRVQQPITPGFRN